jgi:uncharacterized protein
MHSRPLDNTAVSDILDGATILAAGGGGPVQTGKTYAKYIKQSGLKPRLIPFDEVSDGATVAVPIAMGSCATGLENFLDFQLIKALEIFKREVGHVDALIPVETGQVNTLALLYVSAKSGIPLIDGDGTGRSIPEFKNTVFYSHKVSPNPYVMCDSVGNSLVLDAASIDEVDRLGRAICTEMGGMSGVCGIRSSGAKIKEICVPNMISRCETLGRILRENGGGDPVSALLDASDGFLLTEGRIAGMNSKVTRGHDYGSLTVKGLGPFRGQEVIVGFKNEGLIAYLNGKPAVISPDHVFMLDVLTQRPVTFTDAVEGLMVAMLAFRSDPKRRTPADYDGFRDSLRDVGYTGEYVPVEELLAGRRTA